MNNLHHNIKNKNVGNDAFSVKNMSKLEFLNLSTNGLQTIINFFSGKESVTETYDLSGFERGELRRG